MLFLSAVAYAAPSKKMKMDDMVPAEGRSLHSYAPPPPAPRYGGGATVTSYNRRGHSVTGDYSKPSIYGSSYAAPVPAIAPSYRSAPVGYAPVQRYPAPELSHAPRSYGPPSNDYVEPKPLSQDPYYDPSKDPVSQYAEYIPVFEYGPKTRNTGNELSLYGYRK